MKTILGENLLNPQPCPKESIHNRIQRGMCEDCFAWMSREQIDSAQNLGWKNLQIEWRDHYDNANDYHFQLRGTNPYGDIEDVPDNLPMPLDKIFPFEYVGAGYFRRKGIPKGTSAEMLHGSKAIEYLYDQLTKY